MHVHVSQQIVAFRQRTQPIEPDGVQPFENIAILAVLRRATMLVAEFQDILEAGDDPLLARGVGAKLLGRQVDAQFGEDVVVGHVRHWRPPPL
ncbi:hypothetical protein [Sphingobium yanoikuyae]|uniref:hypothetical protein n=1 Tax=Sphingobium yanoikuyae TaxID=13690 RepID=UPI00241D9B56|nr:hypothetical protein [Sphingobium yanoikuyae]